MQELTRREFFRTFAGASAAALMLSTLPSSVDMVRAQETEITQVTFVKGVDLMKWTKDRVRNPLSEEEMGQVMARVAELGVTHVAIVTPYDATLEGIDPTPQTRQWVDAARTHGLSVSHRHMFNEAEGTYDVPKNNSPEFQGQMITRMREWMIQNSDLIKDGDTWTPMPEPQNLGVVGINCGGENCLFASKEEFQTFIQESVRVSRETLEELGLDVEVVCCGFDGFVVAGDNNPDWEGRSFLSPETVELMDNTYASDHYPQTDYRTGERRTYAHYLDLAAQTWPNAQCYLTEVGYEGYADEEPVERMFEAFAEAAERNELRGVWFWFNSEEQLWDDDTFSKLQAGFASLPAGVANSRN